MTKINLYPMQCVYVAKASPDDNFYNKTSVFTGRFSGPCDIYRLFIKFNLDSIEKRIKTIMKAESAFLRLELTRNEVPEVPGVSSLYIYRLSDSFDEKKVTWNTQPPMFGEVDAVTSIPSSKTGTLEIDISNLVKGWLDKSIQNHGILIKGEELINSLVGFPGINYRDKNFSPTLIINFKYENSHGTETSFNEFYTAKSEYFHEYAKSGITEETRKLAQILKNRKYKAIVVYPSAIEWEPIQRPQQFLIELASRGYLCFFCCPPTCEFSVNEIKENLFVLNNEDYLIPYVKNKFVIILCTWLIQMAWADLIPNKLIWYDILDRLEYFSCYDWDMLDKHNQVVKNAEIVTYSAKPLEEFTNGRNDAIYMPNAVNPADFLNNSREFIPNEIKETVSMGKPIIGYFGAIEEWFDDKLIMNLANRQPDWQFVLIGNADIEKRNSLSAPNIRFLGAIKHYNLASYAQHFDVCIIPFKVNRLTNSVSPIKLFEYSSLGKPIVSSPMKEIRQYENKWLNLAGDLNSFEHRILKCLDKNIKKEAAKEGVEFANKNTWAHRIEQFEQKLKLHPKGLLTYANIENTGMAAAMTSTFFGFDGKNFYCGGAERYLYDLFGVFEKLGLRMLVYQQGNSQWVRRYKNMDVISLSDDTDKPQAFKAFNKRFYELTELTTLINIYSAFFEAYPKPSGLNIGISHGIAWDSPASVFNSGDEFWNSNKRYIEAAKLCGNIVSVDTNTANWFQTIDYNLAAKINVIPNYADTDEFTPREHYESQREKTVILFPRRLYSARGFYLMLDIVDDILEKHSNAEFHFVGRGLEEETNKVGEKVKKWGERVKLYSLTLSDMPNAYKNADIVVIPTLYSEGTSLSCLEAMASANAVIATRVGGLTDLIINEYNGILINPTPLDLKSAIEDLLADPLKLCRLKKNALDVSKAFTKSKWEGRWAHIIKSLIDVNSIAKTVPWGLAEIYLQNAKFLQNPTINKLIADLLCKNFLVYVKIKKSSYLQSFGRLQFLEWEEEVLAEADYIIADESSSKIIDKEPNLILKL